MAASMLSVFNKALRWLEERPISATEAAAIANGVGSREATRLLLIEWTDAVETCLYAGYWKFALRTVQANPDTSQKPNFGRKFSYLKPTDWVRTYQVSPDDRFLLLDREYIDEAGVWLSDLPYFFVRYVSNDVNRGLNMASWTPNFTEYLAGYLAWVLAPRIKQDEAKVEALEKRMEKTKAKAAMIDAMDAPPGRIPFGSWVTSRTPRGSIYPLGGGWDEA